MSGISPEPYFRAFQNLVGEHSVKGDPASLYNLTKGDPDPLGYVIYIKESGTKIRNRGPSLNFSQ